MLLLLTLELPNQSKRLILKIHLKYTQIYDFLFQKFSMTFITISEELNYQFVFPSSSHFSKLYMHCTYIYRTSYFDLIVGSSSGKNDYFVCEIVYY